MSFASYWRTTSQRLGLAGEICPHCNARLFPPRDVCPECGGPAQTPFQFSGKGEIYSYSALHVAPRGFETQTPYLTAIVKLEEGPLVTAQLTDVDQSNVFIGMPVEMVTRRIREDGPDGLIYYGYKFRPLLQPIAQ